MRSPVETRCAGVADMCMRRLYQKRSRGRTTLKDLLQRRGSAEKSGRDPRLRQADFTRCRGFRMTMHVASSAVALDGFQDVAVHYEGEDSQEEDQAHLHEAFFHR